MSVPGQFKCNTDGSKTCEGNWDQLNNCTACKSDYYGLDCTTLCVPVDRQYDCTSNGTKSCLAQWAGVDCNSCILDWYGDLCNTKCVPAAGNFVQQEEF